MKTILKTMAMILLFLVVLVLLGCGGYWYYTKTLGDLKTQIISEQEQKALLEQRVSDIKGELEKAEQENQTLADKINSMMVEDVYFFDADGHLVAVSKDDFARQGSRFVACDRNYKNIMSVIATIIELVVNK